MISAWVETCQKLTWRRNFFNLENQNFDSVNIKWSWKHPLKKPKKQKQKQKNKFKFKQGVQGLQAFAFWIVKVNDEHKKTTIMFIIFWEF